METSAYWPLLGMHSSTLIIYDQGNRKKSGVAYISLSQGLSCCDVTPRLKQPGEERAYSICWFISLSSHREVRSRTQRQRAGGRIAPHGMLSSVYDPGPWTGMALLPVGWTLPHWSSIKKQTNRQTNKNQNTSQACLQVSLMEQFSPLRSPILKAMSKSVSS